jgi:hypothetical protein
VADDDPLSRFSKINPAETMALVRRKKDPKRTDDWPVEALLPQLRPLIGRQGVGDGGATRLAYFTWPTGLRCGADFSNRL